MVLFMYIQATFYESQYFLDSLSDIIDCYSNVYDNHILIGDFNLEPSQMYLETFINSQLF